MIEKETYKQLKNKRVWNQTPYICKGYFDIFGKCIGGDKGKQDNEGNDLRKKAPCCKNITFFQGIMFYVIAIMFIVGVFKVVVKVFF